MYHDIMTRWIHHQSLVRCWFLMTVTRSLLRSVEGWVVHFERGLPHHHRRHHHQHYTFRRNFPTILVSRGLTHVTERQLSNDEEDTIFALSSGSGSGSSTATAVAVIRLTGSHSHRVLQILLSKSTKIEDTYTVKLPLPRYSSLRTLYDPNISTWKNNINSSSSSIDRGKEPLDSSLVLLFQSPASFTGEDMVELHCHGSRAVIQGVLEALSNLSKPPYNLPIRPAERGEFTQRAYSHGKLGLLEVEALADLIVADTSTQRLQALRQMDGRLSNLYENWRGELIRGLAHAEAVIDFGDDEDLDGGNAQGHDNDGGLGVWGKIGPRIHNLRRQMQKHLADSNRGEIARDGVRVAIVGPPNSGKSSLLNLLANRDVAIVSPIAGTTRDVIEVNLDLGGVRCILSDTAGVRDESTTSDLIELEGMRRAMMVISQAHILICMLDSSDIQNGITVIKDMLKDSWSTSKAENILLLYNKVDLTGDFNTTFNADPVSFLSEVKSFTVSCTTNAGIEQFLETLTNLVVQRVTVGSSDAMDDEDQHLFQEGVIITRSRHRHHVENASAALKRFEILSGKGPMAIVMAAEEIRLASSELGRITGAVDVEDVLDVLFSDFCIGK